MKCLGAALIIGLIGIVGVFAKPAFAQTQLAGERNLSCRIQSEGIDKRIETPFGSVSFLGLPSGTSLNAQNYDRHSEVNVFGSGNSRILRLELSENSHASVDFFDPRNKKPVHLSCSAEGTDF